VCRATRVTLGGVLTPAASAASDEKPICHYAHAVRPDLPANAFRPVRSRLLWLPVHVAIIAAATALIVSMPWHNPWAAWPLALLLSLVIGHSFAGLAFFGHETLHGAILENRVLRHLAGGIGFLPFAISPTHWVSWHNQVHHRHTGEAGVDPDAQPTLAEYRASRLARFGDELMIGCHRLRGLVVLAVGLNAQSFTVLLAMSRQRRYLSRRGFALAVAETLVGVGFWLTFGLVFGPRVFLFAFGIPLVVANAVVMAYILTNHNLSALTDINDPLLNSLTVTTPRAVSFLHLGFGLHVEHHVFPTMSPRHLPAVRDALKSKFPGRYQSLGFFTALQRLWTSARVYKDPRTLTDPKTGREWPTLASS
jgi:fatty acid desaturase